jgi:conjugal transfer mating pair stabilization protein TraG
MVWEIYAYWNIVELRGVFEAIAMLTNSGNYTTLLLSMMMFGLLAVTVAALTGGNDPISSWRWLVMSLILYMALFVPKTNVALIDRTGIAPPQVVQNVPISLAVFGHVTSRVGDWLTRSYETSMTLITPSYSSDGIGFLDNGLMFGYRIINEAKTLSTSNTTLTSNMTTFYDKCVFPEVDRGNISPYTLFNSNDIWSEISDVNPSLYVTLYDANTRLLKPAAESCTSAYDYISNQLEQQVNSEITRIAGRLYPNDSIPIARSSLESAVTGTYGHFFNISTDAVSVFRQRLAANTLMNSGQLSQQDVFAASQAETLARQQYSTLTQIAQTTVPKLRNVIEMVIYALFPIVMMMIILGGSKGLLVIKAYLIGLMWIQLWAPLYAVMNYLMNSYRQKEFLAEIQPDYALNIMNAHLIQAGAQSDMNIAGMLALAIPMIALAIIKGGEMAMTSFVSGATAPAQMAAMRSAQEVATGELSMGNVQMASRSIANASAFSQSFTPSYQNGAMSFTGMNGITNTVTGDGRMGSDSTGIENRGAAFNLSQAVAKVNTYNEAYNSSLQASYTYGAQAGLTMGQAYTDTNAISRIGSNDTAWQNGFAAKYGINTQNAFKELQSIADSGSITNSNGQNVGTEVLAAVGAAAKYGVSLNSGAYAEARTALSKKFGEEAVTKAEEAFSKMNSEDKSNMASFMEEFGRNEQYQTSFGFQKQDQNTIQSAETKSAELRTAQEAKLTDAKTYQESWQMAQEEKIQATFQLAAAAPSSALSPAARAFALGVGQTQLSEAMVAKQNGDMNTYNAKMDQFNKGLEYFQSQFPSFTRPTEIPTEATGVAGQGQGQDRNVVTTVNRGNLDRIDSADYVNKNSIPTVSVNPESAQQQVEAGKTSLATQGAATASIASGHANQVTNSVNQGVSLIENTPNYISASNLPVDSNGNLQNPDGQILNAIDRTYVNPVTRFVRASSPWSSVLSPIINRDKKDN